MWLRDAAVLVLVVLVACSSNLSTAERNAQKPLLESRMLPNLKFAGQDHRYLRGDTAHQGDQVVRSSMTTGSENNSPAGMTRRTAVATRDDHTIVSDSEERGALPGLTRVESSVKNTGILTKLKSIFSNNPGLAKATTISQKDPSVNKVTTFLEMKPNVAQMKEFIKNNPDINKIKPLEVTAKATRKDVKRVRPLFSKFSATIPFLGTTSYVLTPAAFLTMTIVFAVKMVKNT